jgi:hypothetical protein
VVIIIRNILGGINGDLKCTICEKPRYPHTDICPTCEDSKKIGLAVTSMILGIISILFAVCGCGLGGIIGIVPIIFASIHLHGIKIQRFHNGKGMAIAGLVCGIIAIIPAIVVLIGLLAQTIAGISIFGVNGKI